MRIDQPPSRVRPFTFFAVTFLLSWAIWIPLLLSHWNIGPLRVDEGASNGIRLLGVLMPSITALLLTGLVDGRKGLAALLRRLALWRIGWRWWMAAVLVQPVLLVATAFAYNNLGGTPPIAPVGLALGALVPVAGMLAIATLGEEIGWRGLALPVLQARYTSLAASIILALLWATWHLPFWLLLDTIPLYGLGYLVTNFIFVIAGSLYITWFFNHSRRSLLLPVAFHLSFNLVNVALLPVTSSPTAFLILTACDMLIAVSVLPRLAPATEAAEPAPAA